MAVNPEAFKQALSRFASGVTVVTMADDDLKTGLTVSAFCSVSLEPPYVLACIQNTSTTLSVLRKTQRFGVSILAQDQSGLSNHFASHAPDKFASIPHQMSATGVPLLDGAAAHLACTVVNEFPGGDHAIILGRVDEATVFPDKEPLLYYHSQYGTFQ